MLPNFIKEPPHVHPGVATPEQYRQKQRMVIRHNAQALPGLPWREPWLCLDRPPVFISGGKWVIECSCGNCPSVSLAWGGLALCFECGAVYEGLPLPEQAALIAALLAARPRLMDRYWNPHVSVSDLQDQNAVLGLAEPALVVEGAE